MAFILFPVLFPVAPVLMISLSGQRYGMTADRVLGTNIFNKKHDVVSIGRLWEPHRRAASPAAAQLGGCKVDGILYARDNPTVMIDSKIYSLHEEVCGGTIVDISKENVVIQFRDRRELFNVGGNIR